MLRNTRWNTCWYWDQSTELSTWQCHKDSQTSIGSWDPICYHLPPDNKMKTAKHLSEAKIQSAVTLHLTMKWRQQNTCQKPRSSLLSPSTWQWNEDSKTPVRSRDPVCCHPPPDNEIKTAKHLSELRSSLLSTSIWQWNEDSETPVRAEIQPAVNLHLTMKWRQRNTCQSWDPACCQPPFDNEMKTAKHLSELRSSLLSTSIWQWNEDSETPVRSRDTVCCHPPSDNEMKTVKHSSEAEIQSAVTLHLPVIGKPVNTCWGEDPNCKALLNSTLFLFSRSWLPLGSIGSTTALLVEGMGWCSDARFVAVPEARGCKVKDCGWTTEARAGGSTDISCSCSLPSVIVEWKTVVETPWISNRQKPEHDYTTVLLKS